MPSHLSHGRLCNPPGSLVHGDSPGKITGVDCHALLQGLFPTQGLNPHLLQLLRCMQVISEPLDAALESGDLGSDPNSFSFWLV